MLHGFVMYGITVLNDVYSVRQNKGGIVSACNETLYRMQYLDELHSDILQKLEDPSWQGLSKNRYISVHDGIDAYEIYALFEELKQNVTDLERLAYDYVKVEIIKNVGGESK